MDYQEINFHTEAEAAEALPIVREEPKAMSFSNTVRWIVNLGAFLIPLFFLPWTSDIVELQKQTALIAIAGIGLVIWLIGIIRLGRVKIILTRLGMPILALIIIVGIASLFSLEPARSFLGSASSVSGSFATLVALAVFFLLAISSDNVRGRDIEKAVILSSLIAVLFGVLQGLGWFAAPFGFLKSRIFNTIGSLNSLGVFTAILMPLLVGFNQEYDQVWKWIRNGGIVLCIFVLVLLNWWVIWTVAIIGMTALVAMQSFIYGFKPSRFVVPMTAIVIGIFLLITGLNLTFLKQGLPSEIAPSYKLSFSIASQTLKEAPIFGFGPENFIHAYDRFGSPALANSIFSNVRFRDGTSEFANTVVQTGIAGSLAILFLLAYVIFVLVKRFKYSSISSGEGAALVAGISAYFLYPFNMSIVFLLWILLALTVIRLEGEERGVDISLEESPKYALASSVAFIIGCIVVLAGSYYTVIGYMADAKFASASSEKSTDKALEKIISAINLNSSDSRYYQEASNIILRKISQEIAKTDQDPNRSAVIKDLVNGAFDVAKRSTDKNSHDSSNWAQRGFVYQNLIGIVGGVENPAISAYEEALKRSPSNPSLYNRIGQVYLARSDMNSQLARTAKDGSDRSRIQTQSRDDLLKAQENFKKAAELNQNFGSALYNLGASYERQGKVKEAIGQLEKLVPFNNSNAGLVFELGLLYYRDNRKNDAFDALQRAVQIQPNYSNAHWYLALIYEERGDLDNAVSQLNKILEVDRNEVVLREIENIRAGKPSVIPPERVTEQQPLENQRTQ